LGGLNDLSGNPGDITSATLIAGNWYQISFDLAYNYNSGTPTSSTWTLSDMAVRDWGGDGLTGGGTVMSLALADNLGVYNNIDNDPNVFLIVGSEKGRFGNSIDNIHITAVPELSSIALAVLAMATFIGISRLRRRSRS
jgi:hypothetical protein